MNLCSSLLARWRRFLGRLPPTHAALFQLLLLVLLAANVAGIVITAKRMLHSYAFPTSVMSVRRLDAPPPFTVIVWQPPEANMSASCVELWNNNAPCPESGLAAIDNGQLFAGTVTDQPFTPGDDSFDMWLHAENARRGDCLDVQLLGVSLDSLTSDNLDSIISYAPRTSWIDFCPTLAEGEFYIQRAWVSFSALQDIHGHVNFSISVSAERSTMYPGLGQPLLLLEIDLEGGLAVPWETQEYAYTYMDALASVFANFNISLTVLAFLFPWRYIGRLQSEGREFQLACDKKSDDVTADAETIDLERSTSHAHQLQERMLSHASPSSASSAGRDPDFERALRQMLMEWRRTSARPAEADHH